MAQTMGIKTVLAAATAAGTSLGFSVNNQNPISVFVIGLAGSETGVLQVSLDNGGTYQNTTDDGGTIQATASKNSFLIIGPGEYRIVKSTTASPVAVVIVG